jgi:hypothetical protein
VEGKSIRTLLERPDAEWNEPARTTYEFGNHTVRSEGWRYIRYENGDEELYDETKDPYEWTNLAGDSQLADKKEELAKWLPAKNAADISGPRRGNANNTKAAKQKGAKRRNAAAVE